MICVLENCKSVFHLPEADESVHCREERCIWKSIARGPKVLLKKYPQHHWFHFNELFYFVSTIVVPNANSALTACLLGIALMLPTNLPACIDSACCAKNLGSAVSSCCLTDIRRGIRRQLTYIIGETEVLHCLDTLDLVYGGNAEV